jgi:ferredoxin/flavodoxin---NADP+ reductase
VDVAPLRVAVIGSGPAGFYTTEHLLRQERPVTVDLFDRLPTPFGLVRGGVAPDHPKIKSVTRVYEKIAAHPGFRFFGNVTAGRDLTVADLARHYHAVVWAVGAEADRRLDIPGEDLPGSHTATEFVAWYNGHPDYRDRRFDLTQESAAVVGVGNVAMDVTRILASDPQALARTDIAPYALAALRTSRVRTIYLLGRRGPAQAAFTNPELKEFGELPLADVVVRPADLAPDPATRAALEANPDREAEKNLKTLQGFVERGLLGRPRRIEFRFCTSPLRLEGDGRVQRLVLGANRLVPGSRGVQAVPTGAEESVPVGLVFRSVGYRAEPVEGMPFDPARALIPNDRGRVLHGPGGTVVPGHYVAGWIKRGPSGVIGTNKPDAAETAERLIEDAALGVLPVPAEPAPDAVRLLLSGRGVDVVTWPDWQALDGHEVASGAARGAPREKVTDTGEMLAIIRGARRQR